FTGSEVIRIEEREIQLLRLRGIARPQLRKRLLQQAAHPLRLEQSLRIGVKRKIDQRRIALELRQIARHVLPLATALLRTLTALMIDEMPIDAQSHERSEPRARRIERSDRVLFPPLREEALREVVRIRIGTAVAEAQVHVDRPPVGGDETRESLLSSDRADFGARADGGPPRG